MERGNGKTLSVLVKKNAGEENKTGTERRKAGKSLTVTQMYLSGTEGSTSAATDPTVTSLSSSLPAPKAGEESP